MEEINYNEEIIKLRKALLVSELTILGYSSLDSIGKELNASTGLIDLRRVGKSLESYTHISSLDTYSFSEKREIYETLKRKLTENADFIDSRREVLESARELSYDFCLEMSKKIPFEDWKKYCTVVERAAKLYLQLNADIVGEKTLSSLHIKDLSELDGKNLEDVISDLIDSKEFAESCHIEDTFFVSEADKFDKRLEISGANDHIVRETTVGDILQDLRQSVLEIKEEKLSCMNEFNNLEKYYEAKKIIFGGDRRDDTPGRDD